MKAHTILVPFVLLAFFGLASAPAGAVEAPRTPEAVLDAELTLNAGVLSLSELAELARDQIGVHTAYHKRTGQVLVPLLKPGKHRVRDLLKAICASASLTTEVVTARGRVVICFWPKEPDAHMLAAMMKLARSADEVERSTAARWLEMVGGRDALVQLLKMLDDPSQRVRHYAARSIVEGWTGSGRSDVGAGAVACVAPLGTGLAVAKAIETATWQPIRMNMLRIARHLRDPAVLPALRNQLDNVRPKTNARYSTQVICPAIAAIGGHEAELILLDALDTLPKGYTFSALFNLTSMGGDAAIARIAVQIDITAMKEKRAGYSLLSASLAGSPNLAAATELVRILKLVQDNPVARTGEPVILRHLAKFETPEAQAECLKAFKAAANPAIRKALARYMIRSSAVRKVLFDELAQGGAVARDAAVMLASTHDPRLIPVLIEVLLDGGPSVPIAGSVSPAKGTALKALGRMGGPEAEKAIIAVTRVKGRMREAAFLALGGIASPDARKMLRADLQSPDARVRFSAARALARRPDPADLDPLLTALRKETADAVARAVLDGLGAIGGERAAGELLARTADGNLTAAQALVASRDPHCVQAVRDALAGDDAELHETLLSYVSAGAPPQLSAYYITGAALPGIPEADKKQKLRLLTLLGWSRDPRGIDAIARLLLNADEPEIVRRRIVIIARDAADPAAAVAMRHTADNDDDKWIQRTAAEAIMLWRVKTPGPRDPVGPGDERQFPPPPPDAG